MSMPARATWSGSSYRVQASASVDSLFPNSGNSGGARRSPECARSCQSSSLWRKEPSAPAMLRAGLFRFVCRPRFVETESRERKNATREAPRIITDCSFRSVVFG